MAWNGVFLLNSLLLGLGLSMDAVSVALANGLQSGMLTRRQILDQAGVFALFQFLMPLAGWLCVRTAAARFQALEHWIPWLALALLGYIGVRMLLDGLTQRPDRQDPGPAGPGTLLAQGAATSMDALSVGLTISDYPWGMALAAAAVIAAVTFLLCQGGIRIGSRIGGRLPGWVTAVSGAILLLIAVETFLGKLF